MSLHPKSKTTERFVLNSDPKQGQSNDFQLLVVHGTYISRRTQNMLNNTILFEDFITAYVRTSMVPVSFFYFFYYCLFVNIIYKYKRWDRFWGILRGVQFELYDFEYKEVAYTHIYMLLKNNNKSINRIDLLFILYH